MLVVPTCRLKKLGNRRARETSHGFVRALGSGLATAMGAGQPLLRIE
jgi:hypothetical protein